MCFFFLLVFLLQVSFINSFLVTQLLREGEEQAKQVHQQGKEGLEERGISFTTSLICDEQGRKSSSVVGSTSLDVPQEKMSWSSTTSSQDNRSIGEPSSSFTSPSAGLALIAPGNPVHQHNLVNDHHAPSLPAGTSILNSHPSSSSSSSSTSAFTSSGLVDVGTATPSAFPSTTPPSSMLLPSPRSVSSSFRLTSTPSVCKTAGEEVEYPQPMSLGEKDNSSMNGQGQGQGQGHLLSHEQEVQNDWKAILNESEVPKQGQNSETSEEEVGNK